MKIFIDSADTSLIRDCVLTGLIDGVTTNPSLIRKSGKHPEDVYDAIASLGVNDISMEVTGTAPEMINEGVRLFNKYGDIATIKLPMTIEGLIACNDLHERGIRTNVTLIFNAAQAILAAKAGATYISPFVGRIDDQGYAGTEVVRSCADLMKPNFNTKVLAASIRTTQRVVRSFYNGADIVTMPPKVFFDMYKHVLTDQGLKIFEEAYEATR